MAQISKLRMVVYVVLSVLVAVCNSITFKKLLNKYRSAPLTSQRQGAPSSDLEATAAAAGTHDYEFFVNQFSLLIYTLMSLAIVAWSLLCHGWGWWRRQHIPHFKFSVMGFLDALAGFLSTIGGAYCDGSLQNLINQTTIPFTMALSVCYLGVSYTCTQHLGALSILGGTAISIVPSLTAQSHGHTTTAGVAIFLSSVAPSAGSNVYKEAAFRESKVLLPPHAIPCAVVEAVGEERCCGK